VEEGILNVELMDHPVPGEGKGEDCANSGELEDGAKGLVVVHSRALGKPRRTQRALWRSREPSEVSLWRNSHLMVTMLVFGGHGTRSQVWLARRAAYSSIAHHQCGSARAVRTKEGTGEASSGVVVVSAAKISRSTGRRTTAARRVTIGWTCLGSWWMATGWYTGGSGRSAGTSGAAGVVDSWQ
jgi:hypothetical protein